LDLLTAPLLIQILRFIAGSGYLAQGNKPSLPLLFGIGKQRHCGGW
jgi:hypothetical protein